MKPIATFLIASFLLVACNSGSTSEDSIPGAYLREWTNEFGKVSDTLHIARHESSNYILVRSTTHFRSAAGMASDTNQERTRYSGIYHADSRTMQLDDPSKVLHFTEDGTSFTINENKDPYKKIE